MWICIEEYILFAFEFRPKHIYIQMALASKWKNYGNEDAISDDQILQLAQLEQNAYLFTLERTTFYLFGASVFAFICRSVFFRPIFQFFYSHSLSPQMFSSIRTHTHIETSISTPMVETSENLYTQHRDICHTFRLLFTCNPVSIW